MRSVNVHRMKGKTQAGHVPVQRLPREIHRPHRHSHERSHIPVHKWLLAIHLLRSSKKGMSAHQLHRMLGITYKSAWFLAHRIREAMIESKPTPHGCERKPVQADETYYGNTSKRAKGYKKGQSHKAASLRSLNPSPAKPARSTLSQQR